MTAVTILLAPGMLLAFSLVARRFIVTNLYRSNGSGFIYESLKTVETGWNTFASSTVSSGVTSLTVPGLIRRFSTGVLDYVDASGSGSLDTSRTIGRGWTTYLIAGVENISLLPHPLQAADSK